jgi:hypothetical protein
MTHRIKLFIGFLAFIAVVSVISFFDVFNVAKSLIAEPEQTPLAILGLDEDGDGLSNADESYWNTDYLNPDSDGDGFLDGEETASGHDPTLAGPSDTRLGTNLTNQLADITLAGLVEGSLKPDHPDFEKSIDTLSLSVIDEGIASFIPKDDISKIILIEPTTENQEKYLTQIGAVLELFYKTLADEVINFENKLALIDNGGMANPQYIEFFSKKREEFEIVAQELMKVPTPKNWFQEHSEFLTVISGFAQVNHALAGGKDDPVMATMGFQFFFNLVDTNLPQVLEHYVEKAKSENLSDINPTN